jgi:hypothetical protein
MTNWNTFTPEQVTVAERTFDALSNLDTLTAPNEVKKRKFGFLDLYSFVTGFDCTLDVELEKALEHDKLLRDNLDCLLTETALYQAKQVAAASSGAIDTRQGEGFEIKLHQSHAAPRQTFIMIELKDPTAVPPTSMILSGPRVTCHKILLPEPQDGSIQILENNNSIVVVTLRDINTQVFLR